VSLAEGAGTPATWGSERALRMLAGAGFGRVAVERLTHDPSHLYFVARK
jgi:hypothetical protein